MKEKSDLENLIKNKKAKVAVIGLGYVGLPTAVELAKNGFQVFGIDIKKQRVDLVNQGKSYILDVSSQDLKKLVKSKKAAALPTKRAQKQAGKNSFPFQPLSFLPACFPPKTEWGGSGFMPPSGGEPLGGCRAKRGTGQPPEHLVLVGGTGFEPVTSATCPVRFSWTMLGSNQRPLQCECNALTN